MKNRLMAPPCALRVLLIAGVILVGSTQAWAGAREQAKRIHDRLTGVLPGEAVLNCMQLMIEGNNSDPTSNDCPDSNSGNDANSAALLAMDNRYFYDVTLKNFVMPWTNEDQTKFADMNDYVATVIGMIRDDKPFNTLLSANILYTGSGVSPAAAAGNNTHYQNLESGGYSLKDVLTETTQSAVYGIPANATAGIMTSRAAARAFLVDGTNRAMFRFTVLNHLCTDMEQIKDPTRAHDRVRQDVSRSPGGDSRIFLNNCVGCHAGMDPMVGAYAYYEWNYSGDDPDSGSLEYTPGSVQGKFLINANNFKYGYQTTDDNWINYWRQGPNALLGWDSGRPDRGNGAKSLGEELANTEAFAQCQVKKVFQTVCLRPPVDSADRSQVNTMVTNFKAGGYKMKQVFAETAVYCMGQ